MPVPAGLGPVAAVFGRCLDGLDLVDAICVAVNVERVKGERSGTPINLSFGSNVSKLPTVFHIAKVKRKHTPMF